MERLQTKHLKLHLQIPDDIPSRLRGDPLRLRQILMNLIGNAVKFTENGSVVIAVTKEQEEQSRLVLRFSIHDTGPGISRKEQKHLFQPFSQADSTTARRHGGTGLGLSISKQLVELMGGTIGLNSIPGHGSAFWFSLPFEKQTPYPMADSRLKVRVKGEDAAPAGPLDARILIAEDNLINRTLTIRQLNKLGYAHVRAVTNGQEALEAAKEFPFDLILMDCQMPRMDGYQATMEIRRMEKGRRTPIIALTAHALEEDRRRCLAAGMDYYLSKPVQLPQLRSLLEERLSIAVPIDLPKLRATISPDDPDFEKIMDVYLEDTEKHLGHLEKAIQEQETIKVKDLAHSALGASLVLGMKAVAEPLRKLEQLGIGEDLSYASDILHEAKEKLGQTRTYLKQNPRGVPS